MSLTSPSDCRGARRDLLGDYALGEHAGDQVHGNSGGLKDQECEPSLPDRRPPVVAAEPAPSDWPSRSFAAAKPAIGTMSLAAWRADERAQNNLVKRLGRLGPGSFVRSVPGIARESAPGIGVTDEPPDIEYYSGAAEFRFAVLPCFARITHAVHPRIPSKRPDGRPWSSRWRRRAALLRGPIPPPIAR